jgi:hypothetical protein
VDQFFSETKAIADDIEGMLSPFSMAAVDSLLALQAQRGITGDIVEMGTFRGKSAAVLGRRMSQAETLHLFDIEDYLDRDSLRRAGTNFDFTLADTLDLSRWKLRKFKKSVRFCHVDASHAFDPTVHEMGLADYMLSNEGILCLDDFANLNFSQILAATYKYLFTKPTNLTVFLVTAEKAYLCRKSAFPAYAKFIVDGLIPSMLERGVPNTCIARTDISRNYRAFHLREKAAGETDDHYAESIYGHFFQTRKATFAERARFVGRKIRAAMPLG